MANFTQYLRIDALEGGADTFVEANVATEIVPADGYGILLRAIEITFTAGAFNTLGADAYAYWSLTRDTKVAVAAYDDADCFLSDGFNFALTTSGAVLVPSRWEYRPVAGIPIVEPYIYMQLDSNATGVALHAFCRMEYERVKLSEVEILRILNEG